MGDRYSWAARVYYRLAGELDRLLGAHDYAAALPVELAMADLWEVLSEGDKSDLDFVWRMASQVEPF